MMPEKDETFISEAKYKEARNSAWRRIAAYICVIPFASILPCAVIWAGCSALDDTLGAWIGAFLFVGGAITVWGFILAGILSDISKIRKQQNEVKQKYLDSMPADEKKLRDQKIKHANTVASVCLAVAAACFVVFVVVRQCYRGSVYSAAEALIAEEKFDEAEEQLKRIENSDYKDTTALLLLCQAHKDYSEGYPSGAHSAMKKAVFRDQTPEAGKRIDQFRQAVEAAYKQYNTELEARRKKEYSEMIARGVPFVGMPESEIKHTSLGVPSDKVRHNSELKNGKQCIANLYDFYQGQNRIFTARCVQGKVTEVWDYRNDPIRSYVPAKSAAYSREPDVSRFKNPEDFYDWYWDDFFDYYDAEDYYYEHGGK